MSDSIQQVLIDARRHQILDAAAAIFAAKGFHATTTKDIARQAGIAEGTIYNYFDNKHALLFGILERMRETAIANTDYANVPVQDFRAFVKAYLRQPLMAFQADNFALFRIVMSEIMVNQALRERYFKEIVEPTLSLAKPHFQHWADQQAIKPLDLDLMMRVISGAILGLTFEYIMGDATLQTTWDSLPDFLADLILDGIASSRQ